MKATKISHNKKPREEILADMLSIIRKKPGIRPKELHKLLGLEHSWSLRSALIKRGLVSKEKDGAATRYYPSKSTRKKIVTVNDKMQKNYRYELTEPAGKNFHHDFKPELTPKQMLALGVFGGKYMTDCKKEFPKDWFTRAKLSPEHHDDTLNYFHKHASQPLGVWIEKGWINKKHDPRGWFQWYCRYYMGRRLPKEDERQIKRWKAIKRHVAQIKKNCKKRDMKCRPKQRQVLLHWAYDARKI